MAIKSQTSLQDLQLQQSYVQSQILEYSEQLHTQLQKYSLTSDSETHHQTCFYHSYYLNELLGYLREQHNFISRCITHLEDQGPNPQWDAKAFFDYSADQNLKLKCLNTLRNPYFHQLWLKQIHFLVKSQHHKHSLLTQNMVSYQNSVGNKFQPTAQQIYS